METAGQRRPGSATPAEGSPDAAARELPGRRTDDAPQDGGWTLRSVYILGLLTVIWALSFADRQLLALLSPLIQKDLGLNDTSLGLITGLVFVLFYSLLGVPVARIADRTSRRNVLGAGLALWSIMTALTGLAANVGQLVLTRLFMGAGEAAANAPATSLAEDVVGKPRRQIAMAVLSTGSSLSALLFIPAAGWIAQTWGWRASFTVAGFLGIALVALLFSSVREARRGRGGAPREREDAWVTARFLMGSRAYVLTVAGGAFIGISLYASQAWHPSFLSRVHHLGIAQIGMTTGVLRGLAGMTGALLGGVLAERLGRRNASWRLLLPGIACILALPSELLFLLSPELKLALVGMCGYHLFTGMHFGPVYAACHSLARPGMRCTATAVFLLGANVTGQVVGPLAVGFLNDHWAAAFGAQTIRYSLAVAAVFVLIGGLLLALGSRTVSSDTFRAEA